MAAQTKGYRAMRMGDWTSGKREAPEPLEGNVPATVLTGTAIWGVLFLAQVPFYRWYADRGYDWWIWSCLAGVGLGVLGWWMVRRRAISSDASPAPRDESLSD